MNSCKRTCMVQEGEETAQDGSASCDRTGTRIGPPSFSWFQALPCCS